MMSLPAVLGMCSVAGFAVMGFILLFPKVRKEWVIGTFRVLWVVLAVMGALGMLSLWQRQYGCLWN